MAQKNQYSIFKEIDELKNNYLTDRIQIIEGLYFSQYNVIKMAEFYSNSRYLKLGVNGEYNLDGMGRDKPFYNIVNYRVMLAKTATDLDIKDIQITSDNPKHQVKSMLLNREAYEYMKESDFSLTLNKMGNTRPKYGGYLIKKTEVNGKLKIDVVGWTKVYTDQSDILGGPIIEEHYMSLSELKKKAKVWDNVDEVIKAHNNQKSTDKTNRILAYETTGEFPLSIYKNFENNGKDLEDREEVSEDDKYDYSLQRYFVCEVNGVKYPMRCDNFPTKELTDFYEYLSWEEMEGRGLGRGVIEDSEEAQVWTNDAVINEKNAMDLAGKVVMKTTSKKLANNILEVDNGKIFELTANDQLESLNLTPAALGEFENQINRWKSQANDATNSYDATTGKQPPADTPYSQTALLNQIGMKPFDYKREEWGIHLTTIFDKWIIPYLIKRIKKNHILVSDFTDQELDIIDQDFAVANSNADLINRMLSGKPVTPDLQNNLTAGYKAHIKKLGKKRFLEVPDNFFDDIDAKVTVNITGEQKNKAAILQSLATIMADVTKSYNSQTGKFQLLEDPVLSQIFATIVELSGAGISPVSLGIGMNAGKAQPNPATPPVPPAPVQPVAGSGAPSIPSQLAMNMRGPVQTQ